MFKYKLIIFDFDGTLASTHKAITKSMIETFNLFRIKAPTKQVIRQTIGLTLEKAFNTLLGEQGQSADIQNWLETYRKIYAENEPKYVQLFPDVARFLQFAKKSGIKTVIVSNKKKNAINTTLTRLYIHDCVNLVIGGDVDIPKKPAPDLFWQLIQPAFPNISIKHTLMVGDTDIDLWFAKKIGLDCSWAKYGYGDKTKCSALRPKYSIIKIQELYDIIKDE